MDWDERAENMRKDLHDEEYDYLYFKIALNLNDAIDNADYERERILKDLLDARRKMDNSAMLFFINKLAKLDK